jgi:hypothetical protein
METQSVTHYAEVNPLTSIAVKRQKLRRPAYVFPRAESHHVQLAELCSVLFQSLPRSDQRRRGLEYIQGLLAARGRKSIRNIATVNGRQAAEQSLHHFVSNSTWDWAPVRQALAQYVSIVAPPQAWVMRTIVIPKAGKHSVGVDRRFFSDLGQIRNAQQAVGIWAASEELRTPVNWRLQLSKDWLDDSGRRDRASIPKDAVQETIGEGTIDAYLELVEQWGLPVRPLILDARDLNATAIVGKLRAARVPFLARVSTTSRFTVADSALTGHDGALLSAQDIMRAVRHLRRPAVWRDTSPEPTPHTCLVASVRVRVPGIAGEPEMMLLAASDIGQSWPAELWLTNLPDTDPVMLARLTRLVRGVDQDITEVADQVGVRDFTGRSYCGWHRHVTLASAAYTVSMLTDRTVRAAA